MQPAVLHRVPGTGTPIAALAIGTHVIPTRKSLSLGSPTEVAGGSLRWGDQAPMNALISVSNGAIYDTSMGLYTLNYIEMTGGGFGDTVLAE